MTLKGKLFMWAFLVLIGVSVGGYYAYKAGHAAGYSLGFKAGEEAGYRAKANEGNQINVDFNGKVKKDADIKVNIEGNSQSVERTETTRLESENEDEAKWWQFWK